MNSAALADTAMAWLTRLTRRQAMLLVVAISGTLLVLDARLAADVRVAPFHMLSICIAAWSIGLRGGFAAAAAAVSASGFSDYLHGSEALTLIWNVGARGFAYLLVAGLIAAARRQHDRERHAARFDALTGAVNKAAFDGLIDRRLASARGPLALAYVDLDGFKAANDGYGHAMGDAMLRTFAAAAIGAVGDDGVVGRLGGDEFGLLFAIDDDVYAAADRLHARLSDSIAAMPGNVTCSMGVVVARVAPPGGRAALVALADATMYEVKRRGKDGLRVVDMSDPGATATRPTPRLVPRNGAAAMPAMRRRA